MDDLTARANAVLAAYDVAKWHGIAYPADPIAALLREALADRERLCPECRDGKHRNCTHTADYHPDGAPVDCRCGCEPSRTCPSCADVVPAGWTLDDHLNCNWPE